MRLPKLAIDNHQFTLTFFALLLVLGIASFMTMPRSEDPEVTGNGSSIVVIYPGANPTDIEELVVEPIEEAVNELEDIKEIASYAGDGLAVINIKYLFSADSDEKYREVAQKVNGVQSILPDEIIKLDIAKWEVGDVSILQLALISDSASYKALEKTAKGLKKEIEKVSGIRKVEIHACPEQEIKVSINPGRMSQNNIGIGQIFKALSESGANIPGGSIDMGGKKFNVTTSGNYDDIDDIKNTIIHSMGGIPVFLKDVADVYPGYEDIKYKARLDGRKAIWVSITQKNGTNIFTVMENLKAKLAEFASTIPPHIAMDYVFDQSESVDSRLSVFFSNLLQGLFLVGLVVLLAVGFRASIIVMIAIPISLFIGIFAIANSGFGLQQMTIAGLVIALGLLVDNAIVVTENITRFMKMGYSRREAAYLGTSQIGWAVVSSTVTTVLAFVPMIMIGEDVGQFIRSLPLTVVYSLVASLILSLSLTPFLLSKFLKKPKMIQTRDSGPEAIEKNPIRRYFDRFVSTVYRRMLGKAVKHSFTTIAIALCSLVGSVVFASFFIGLSFFPKAEKPQFFIEINAPAGTNLDKTDKYASMVEEYLASREEVKRFATNVGHGNPKVYYNVLPKNYNSGYAQLLVEVKEEYMDSMEELYSELRKRFSDIPGVKIDVKELEQGPPIEAPIAIKVIGDDLDMLKKLSKDVENMIESVSGTININNPLSTTKTDLHIDINRYKASMLGVSLIDIDKTVRANLAGVPVSRYRDSDGKNYDIVVRLPSKKKVSVDDFGKVYIQSSSGANIPLRQIARVEFVASPLSINHFNLIRNVSITADVISGQSVLEATSKVVGQLEEYQWPEGYQFQVKGEQESREESFGGMLQAILIAMIGIFAVLVLQFKSYIQPFIVFSAIPLAIIGSIFALFIMGLTFSFMAFVGLTSLVGIVVNNSIILVDYINKLRQGGKDVIEAIKEAGETRFMPIVLTTATTVGGLLPLTVLGGKMWAPMGWTIIGGLIASTFLTLFVVPALYKITYRLSGMMKFGK